MIGDGVAHELVVIARKLVDDDPEATFSDLLKTYFGYITGRDYDDALDNPPDDEHIITLHLKGYNTDCIAVILEDDGDYVKWILLTYGFSPNTKTPEALAAERAHYERLVNDELL